MKYKLSNKSTQIIIDELGEEYKDLIIERVLSTSNEVDIDDINVSELIRIDINTKKNLKEKSRDIKRKRMFDVLFLIGIIYAFAGVFIIFILYAYNSLFKSTRSIFPLIVMLIGLSMSTISILVRATTSLRKDNKGYNFSYYMVLSKWRELEALTMQLTPEDEQKTLRNIISYLHKYKMISEQDVRYIDDFLAIRNTVAHGKEEEINNISKERLNTLINRIDEIINRLSKIL